MAKEIRCAECGAKCFDTDSYCPKCYASISAQDIKNDDMLEGILTENWKQFIVDKSADYIEIFRKNENKKIFVSFHPWAFLFGTSWMYYRKMYLQAIITTFIGILIIVMGVLLNGGPLMLLMFPAAILLKVLVGAFAHCIYRNHVKSKLLKSENNIKKGGTSVATVIIGTIASSLVITFIIEPLLLILAIVS